ncbi:MAG: ATP-dependent DNA helicase RecG [Thermoguttaceae bacterium]|nr:ATP-dependent DNA helicase RecG [Thermoguttaceae bacterium]
MDENLKRDPLRAPVASVGGVGPVLAEILARLGIYRAFDLLFYFPRDYREIFLKRSIDELVEGEVQSVVGTIENFYSKFTRIGQITTLVLAVGTELVRANWFKLSYISNGFRVGRRLMMTGAPKFKDGIWTFTHPILEYLDDPSPSSDPDVDDLELDDFRVVPVYRLTEGLTAYRMRRAIKTALRALPDLLPEALPKELLEKRSLPSVAEAVRKIHFPATLDEAEFARRRFAYQELLVLQLALSICRTRRRVNMKAPSLPRSAKIDSRIRSLFPFELTEAQEKAIREISDDMAEPTPMNRLLQGDVGAGKTVVAIYAALQAAANGAQAVIMAPTESLARQHLRTLRYYLRDSSIQIAPVFGGQKPAERAEILERLKSGSAQIAVGTQALVYGEIEFQRLGLVIIDEQHKFGVRQRALLKSSQELEPHYLVMTATPIPRSVSMTLFGDLDVSLMRGLPPGRRKTTTSVLTSENRASWWKFVRDRLDEGRQAYVVAPRVDGGLDVDPTEIRAANRLENDGSFSSDFDFWNDWIPEKKVPDDPDSKGEGNPDDASAPRLKTVWSIYKELSEGELKGYRLGVLHGRMTSAEKEKIMLDFRGGAIQVLIATSVIEVGIDVPNATIMTVENAERFGLAQLHQLRGRVSRGKFPGFCAVAPSEYPEDEKRDETSTKKKKSRKKKTPKTGPDNESETRAPAATPREEGLRRLKFFAGTTDGFELAEEDFASRGPGELFGAKQHGVASFRVADLSRDRQIVELAREDAREIVSKDPALANPDLRALRKQVFARYGKEMDLGDVG